MGAWLLPSGQPRLHQDFWLDCTSLLFYLLNSYSETGQEQGPEFPEATFHQKPAAEIRDASKAKWKRERERESATPKPPPSKQERDRER